MSEFRSMINSNQFASCQQGFGRSRDEKRGTNKVMDRSIVTRGRLRRKWFPTYPFLPRWCTYAIRTHLLWQQRIFLNETTARQHVNMWLRRPDFNHQLWLSRRFGRTSQKSFWGNDRPNATLSRFDKLFRSHLCLMDINTKIYLLCVDTVCVIGRSSLRSWMRRREAGYTPVDVTEFSGGKSWSNPKPS